MHMTLLGGVMALRIVIVIPI